jgi:hypothetical protein
MARPTKRPTIDGLYELGHIFYALEGGARGFERTDIAEVESYWTFGDMHSSTAGFVFRLKDGRRPYVDYSHWHAFEQDEDFRIEIFLLEDGERVPKLAAGKQPPDGWSTETAHLNRMVAAG